MHNSGMIAFPPLDSTDLKAILRPAPEPVRFVDDALAHSVLLADPLAYLAFLEQGLRDIAFGDMALTLPPKAVFDEGPGKGDFRVMPCVTRGANGLVKTVKVVGTNLIQHDVPDQVTVGKAMLLHPEENYVTHLFDANALSSIRTGACVALAIRLLAARRRNLLFVGAGRVGFYGAVFAGALDGTETMRFMDIEEGRADALARLLARQNPGIAYSSQPPGPDDRADVVVLATTAASPFCRPPAWGAALVVSVGADTNFQHELDAAWAGKADIFVDTHDSARFGDLRRWLADGLIRQEDLRDLFDVLRHGPAVTRPGLFVSTGSALFDNLTMAYLSERLPPAIQSSEMKSSNL